MVPSYTPPRGCTAPQGGFARESPPTGQVLTEYPVNLALTGHEQAAIFSAIGLAAQGPGMGGSVAPKNERTCSKGS